MLIVAGLSELALADDERDALAKACPYFSTEYLDYLASVRLRPQEQVEMTFHPKLDDGRMGEIACVIRGLWREVILYEVPIMSICEFSL